MENSEFLTESQTLAYAGIDRNILTRFCETGYIKTKMLANGQVLYSKTEIERVFGKRREVLQNSLNQNTQAVSQVASQAKVANSSVSYSNNTYDFDDFNDFSDIRNDADRQYNETIASQKNEKVDIIAATEDFAGKVDNNIQNNVQNNIPNQEKPLTSASRLIKFPETTKTNDFSKDFKDSFQNSVNVPKGFDYYSQHNYRQSISDIENSIGNNIRNNAENNLENNLENNVENFNKFQKPKNDFMATRNDAQPKVTPSASSLQANNSVQINNLQSNPNVASNLQTKQALQNQVKPNAIKIAPNGNFATFNTTTNNTATNNTTANNVATNNTTNVNFEHQKNSEQIKKLQSEVENLKQEIVKLQSYARLQKKLLEVKEKEIAELKQEKDWLKNRIETQEEKNNRDQLLILSETRVIHNLIASAQKSSPIRTALEWFGLAKKNRQETIDMIKQ